MQDCSALIFIWTSVKASICCLSWVLSLWQQMQSLESWSTWKGKQVMEKSCSQDSDPEPTFKTPRDSSAQRSCCGIPCGVVLPKPPLHPPRQPPCWFSQHARHSAKGPISPGHHGAPPCSWSSPGFLRRKAKEPSPLSHSLKAGARPTEARRLCFFHLQLKYCS